MTQLVWNCPFSILRHRQSNFLYNDVYMTLKIIFIIANSSDSDETRPYAAFHLSLHCFPKYLFTDILNEKGLSDGMIVMEKLELCLNHFKLKRILIRYACQDQIY